MTAVKRGKVHIISISFKFCLCFSLLVLLIAWTKTSAFASNEPQVTISPRVETAHIGDTVYFDYEISGIDNNHIHIISFYYYYTDEELSVFQTTDGTELYDLSGTIPVDATYGYGIAVDISVTDSVGVHSKKSSIVRIVEETSQIPQITITPRVETAHIGDTIYFDYEITGIDNYNYISKAYFYYTDEELTDFTGSVFPSMGGPGLDFPSGSIAIDATHGYGIALQVSIDDSNDHFYSNTSSIVRIVQHPAFALPDSLERVETEAFSGISAKAIFIPSSVNSIDLDAFSPDVTICAENGSYAAQWAQDNGFHLIITGN